MKQLTTGVMRHGALKINRINEMESYFMFKKNFSLIIIFIFLCSIPNIIFAVENYNPKDVEVINRILLENDNTNKKLAKQGWKINKPETWQRYGKDID